MQDDTVLCTEESAPDTGMPPELEVEYSRMFIPARGVKVCTCTLTTCLEACLGWNGV